MNFKKYYQSKQDLVNRELRRLFAGKKIPRRLRQAASYSLNAGGKRLRSVLCLMVDDVLSAKFDDGHHADVLRLALSLECIHTYSLIHDDLPSMDDDDLRRGQPTCHIQYDEATAILAGDSLLTFAFELYGGLEKVKSLEGLKKLILTISRAAGAEGMAGGQMLDVEADGGPSGTPMKLAELRKIHTLKTGALIKAAVLLPVHYRQQHAGPFESYADSIGIAFQIVDDILDVTSTSEVLGKPAGSDVQNQRATYVSILGLEEAQKHALKTRDKAIKALSLIKKDTRYLRSLADYIVERIN